MNKAILNALRNQTVSSEHGIEEYHSVSFMNIVLQQPDGSDLHIPPPANLRLRISNQPVMGYREVRRGREMERIPTAPSTIRADELVAVQLGLELQELGGSRRKNLDPTVLEQLEYFEGLKVLEYHTDIEISYGKEDFVEPQRALDLPELNYIGREIIELIEQGLMDVLLVDASEQSGKPTKVSRPHTLLVNLWDIRRIMAKNTVPAMIPDQLGEPGDRFYKLTGSKNQTLGLTAGIFPTHIIIGRLPERGAKPRGLDYRPGCKLGQVKRGQPRRGYLAILPLQHGKHAVATLQDQLTPQPVASDNPIATAMTSFLEGLTELLPGLDNVQEETLAQALDKLTMGLVEETRQATPHMNWLASHPTQSSHDAIRFLTAEDEPETAPETVAEQAPAEAAQEPETPAEQAQVKDAAEVALAETGTEAPVVMSVHPEDLVVPAEQPTEQAPDEAANAAQTEPVQVIPVAPPQQNAFEILNS